MQRNTARLLTIAAQIFALRVADCEITAKAVADPGSCLEYITVIRLLNIENLTRLK